MTGFIPTYGFGGGFSLATFGYGKFRIIAPSSLVSFRRQAFIRFEKRVWLVAEEKC